MNLGALRAKLYDCKITNSALAERLGLSKSALHRKMSGETEFKRPEINEMIKIFGLDEKEVMSIFFENKCLK